MRARADPEEIGLFVQDSGTIEKLRCWPMSSGQLRVRFVEQLAQGSAIHNLFFCVQLIGELNKAALDLSLRAVCDRHEALRTTFHIRDGQPVQLVDGARPPTLGLIDLSGRPAAVLAEEAYARARDEINKAFDLSRGPLVRLVLLRLEPDSQLMLVILHHIICDGWSLGLFANELAASYAAFSTGASPELKPLRLQYGDYANWQREWLGGQDFERQLSYWIDKLAGARMALRLSANDEQPTERSFAGASRARRLPDDLVRQLKAVATKYNTTSFAFLLAALQIVLCQYSGEADIIVGMPVAGRNSVEVEEVIGLFANLVAIRTDVSGDPAFADLLQKARNAILDALMNQDVPFERLVEALHPSRNLAQNPIFQVLFTSIKTAASWKNFGTLKASPYFVEPSAVPFDLSVASFEEAGETSWICADYRTDLFTIEQIDCFLDHYVKLLRTVAAGPHTRLSQLRRPPDWPVVKNLRGRQGASNTRAVPREFGDAAPQYAVETDLTQRTWISDPSNNLVEDTLTRLWAKVVGIKPPAATSNFFDIGGHSLRAAYLAAEISKAYRINFPVSLIFQGPTIEAMARRLRAGVSAISSVVCIQESGSLPPFFCGGSMREFLDLSHALGSEQPFFQLDIFALQQQRLFADQPIYTSVPDLAARFRRDILTIQPTGPYLLGGMCEGGIIALEIALQLQAQGHEIALLAEFDTPVNGYWRKRAIDWVLHGWSLIYSGRLVPRMRDHTRARLTRRVTRSPEEETYSYIVKVTWEAIRAYRPDRVFEGEIHLFRSPRSPPWPYEDAAAGWHARASQGIRVHDVVGEHVEIFCAPLSQRIIARAIAQAHCRSVTK